MSSKQLPEGYKQTAIGLIPEDWDVRSCSEISERIMVGIVIRPAQYYVLQGVPAFRSANIRENGISDSDLVFISDASNTLLAKSQTRVGDILTVRTGYPGTSAVVRPKHAGCNCIDILITRPSKKIDSNYLAIWINSSFGKDQVLRNQGGLAQKHFNVGDMRDLLIALPALPEQKSIAQALSDVDALIAALEKTIAKKRAIKTATMQQLLTGKKRLPGFGEGKGYQQTDVGVIPEDWKVKPLSLIVNFTNGKAHENDVKESGRYIVVNSKFISSEAQVKKYSDRCYCPTQKENILMVMSDVPNGRAIAKCFLVDKDNTYTVNQRICSLEVTGESPRFVFYQLDRNPFYLQFDDGVKQTNLRRDEVLACLLPMPILKEQQAIAAVLSDMDAEIAAIETRLAKTQAIKQGMMQELLTGRTRLV